MAAGDIKIIANEGYVDNKVSVVDSKVDVVSKSSNPFSGYMEYTKKADNFVFEESEAFAGKVGDKNRYLDFNGDMVDTYGPELVTNGDFSDGTTGWSVSNSGIYEDNGRLVIINNDVTKNIVQPSTMKKGKAYNIRLSGKGLFQLRISKDSTSIIATSSFDYHTTTSDIDIIYTPELDNPAFGIVHYDTHDDSIIDNISVREIQTADLSDKIPDVTVQDQATNGLTTQSDVSAGDYVVLDREELVTNGTFDSDTSGWSGIRGDETLSVDTQRLKVVNGTTDNGGAYQAITGLTIGKTYKVSAVVDFGTASDATLQIVNSGGTNTYTSASMFDGETTTVLVTPTETTIRVWVKNESTVDGDYNFYDNISVKQVDESYRAIQDAPAGTELTTTEYFEVRDQQGIYNQVAVLHKYDPSTKTYLGMVSEVLFNEMEANETPKQFMLKNGFSQISEGCYSKDGYYYIVSGVYSTYNSGCHHPDYNFYGCRKASDDNFWYESSDTFTCVADCF
jgi:hypothetical protein